MDCAEVVEDAGADYEALHCFVEGGWVQAEAEHYGCFVGVDVVHFVDVVGVGED